MFFHIVTDNAASLKYSVTIQEGMTLSVFMNKVKITVLSEDCPLPDGIQDMRLLQNLLQQIEKFDPHCTPSCSSDSLSSVFALLQSVLEDIRNTALATEELKEALLFLWEQVELMGNAKSLQYSSDLMVFASILFSTSPHAYKFLRGSSKLRLPHPSTIRQICASFQVNPQKEQDSHVFWRT